MRVASFTEPFDSVFQRRIRSGGEDRPIDVERRAALNRQVIFAEPVVIFPFGEIVNGTEGPLLTQSAGLEGPLGAAGDRRAAK